MPKAIKVALRYDDLSASSPLHVETGILDACVRHRIRCTFGVIPKEAAGPDAPAAPGFSDAKIALLKRGLEGGFLEAALHGLTHKTRNPRRKSEFVGVHRDEQHAMLREGVDILRTLVGEVSTFIPPWNTYDTSTLEAIASAGLTTLSADGEGMPAHTAGLRFVPATCLLTQIKDAVAHARRVAAAKPGRTVMVIPYFHPYEFKESGSPRALFSLAEFEGILAWLAAQPDTESLTIAEMGRLEAATPEAYRGYSRWRRRVPSFLEKALLPAFWAYPFAVLPGR